MTESNAVFESLYDKSVAKPLYESELEVGSILYECQILSMNNGIVTEESDDTNKAQKTKKFSEFIDRVIDSIVSAIKNAASAIRDIFSSKENIDAYAYLRSNTGTINMDYDLDKIYKDTQKSVDEGNKAIRAIANLKDKAVHKLAEKTIADMEGNFPDKAAKAVGFSTAVVMYEKYAKSSTYHTLSRDVQAAKSTAKQVISKNPEYQPDIMRIYAHMSTAVNKCMNSITIGLKQIVHESKRNGRLGAEALSAMGKLY